MAKPEYNWVIVQCETEQDAQDVLTIIIDQCPEASIWPALAYDDGFGRLVRKDD